MVKREKRLFWKINQSELRNSGKAKDNIFWKKIGNIGVENERKNLIPMEISLEDGSISKDTTMIPNKWKEDFNTLLNSGKGNTNLPAVSNIGTDDSQNICS